MDSLEEQEFTFPGSSFLLSDGTLICGAKSLEQLQRNREFALDGRKRDEYENGKRLIKLTVSRVSGTIGDDRDDRIIRNAWLWDYEKESGRVDFGYSFNVGTFSSSSFTHKESTD